MSYNQAMSFLVRSTREEFMTRYNRLSDVRRDELKSFLDRVSWNTNIHTMDQYEQCLLAEQRLYWIAGLTDDQSIRMRYGVA